MYIEADIIKLYSSFTCYAEHSTFACSLLLTPCSWMCEVCRCVTSVSKIILGMFVASQKSRNVPTG